VVVQVTSNESQAQTDTEQQLFIEAVQNLRAAHEHVESVASDFAADITPGGAVEARLLEAFSTRKQIFRQVGETLLRCLVAGNDVEVITPTVVEGSQVKDDVIEPSSGSPQRGQVVDLADVLAELREEEQAERQVQSPSEEALQRLVDWSKVSNPDALPHVATLAEVLDALGPPQQVTSDDYDEDMAKLQAAIDAMSQWQAFDCTTQRALLGLVASRLRYLQDEVISPDVHGNPETVFQPLFKALTFFSALEKPGFVFGLAQSHKPQADTWLKDARYWWDVLQQIAGRKQVTSRNQDDFPNPDRAVRFLAELSGEDEVDREDLTKAAVACLEAKVSPSDQRLVKILLPHLELLTKERRLKATRKAIRDYQKELDQDCQSSDSNTSKVPVSWPHWSRVEGARVLVIGGEQREGAAERMSEAFRFSSLEWDSGWNTRRLNSMAQRVAAKSVDLVVCLTNFMSHKAWWAMVSACKTAGVSYVAVERGYGVNQIQAAMEAAFGSK